MLMMFIGGKFMGSTIVAEMDDSWVDRLINGKWFS